MNPSSAHTVRQQAFGLEQKHRTFAAQLDALVRVHRTGLADVTRLAEALSSASTALGHLGLEVAPTCLRVGAQPVLEAEGELGRWILPAFMAGVRRVKLGQTASLLNLIEFTRRVADLKVDGEAIQDFHDWLWADGAEGLEIDLLPSFVESVETAGVAELQLAAMALRPDAAIDGDGHAVTIDSRELDTAAARAEFEVPLAAYAAALSSRHLELRGAEFSAARQAVDEPGLWAEAEIDVVLSQPRLRLAVPPSRLVKAVLARFETHCDARMVRLFSRFLAQTDEFSRSVVEGLLRERLGALMGARLQADEGGVAEPLLELLRAGPPELRASLLSALLDRAAEEPPVQGLLQRILAGLGVAAFAGAVDVPSLGASQGQALVALLIGAGTQASALEPVLERLAPKVAAGAIANLPLATWSALSTVMVRLLVLGEPEVSSVLLGRALKEPGQRLSHLSAPLLKTAARGVPEALVKPLAARLLQDRQSEVLVQLALRRDVPEGSRLRLLEALASDRALAREVSHFRFAEYLDPPAVRERLRLMRRLSSRPRVQTAGRP